MHETMNAIVGFLRERGLTVEYWAPEPTRTIDIYKHPPTPRTTLSGLVRETYSKCRGLFEPDDASFRISNMSHSTHFTAINIADPDFFDKLLIAIDRWAEPGEKWTNMVKGERS